MRSVRETVAREATTVIRKRFRTLLEIGRGGMSQIFLAESLSFDVRKLVVLKILNQELALHPEMRAAFRREADITARMNHPNVVQVFEVLDEAGQAVIVMEYLDGLPLSRVVREVKPPLELHLDILAQVLAGLHHFHELRDLDDSPLNAVHRDVSPQNVLLLHEGVAKVLDFGVAKFNAGHPDQTRSGLVKGKIQYMPPEQLLGNAEVDRRADIFAVGAMLWEAVAGRRLWHGLTDREVMRALALGEIPGLRAVVSDLDPEIEAIVTRALEPDPERRYATAKDMQAALEQVMPKTIGGAWSRGLATFMQEHFAEARGLQKLKLDAVRRNPSIDLSLGELQRRPAEGAPPEESAATSRLPAGEARGSFIAEDRAPKSASDTRARRRSRLMVVLALLLGACGVAFGLYKARVQRVMPQVSQPRHVQFQVLADPAEAEILLDGSPVAHGKYQGTQQFSKQQRRLLVQAAGYSPHEESVRFDADVLRLIRLERRSAAVPSAAEVARAVITARDGSARAPAALEKAESLPSLTTPLPANAPNDAAEPRTAPSATEALAVALTSASPASAPSAETPAVPPPASRIKQVSPKVAHALLAVNVAEDPYRVRLPPALERMGAALETLVKICVTAEGSVSRVAVVRSADPALDEQIRSTVPRWRYSPLLAEARPVPFCYTVNLRFESRRY